MYSKVLQCQEGEPALKRFLCRYLPFLPASLPTLLFCRLAELTIMLEDDTLLSREVWEAAVQERIVLSWMANDVKIIGRCYLPCAYKRQAGKQNH